MRSNTSLLAAVLLSSLSVAIASPKPHLMKRHYWCNGVDSDDICPEGETMVPIDQYACDHIAEAGRQSQVSGPVNGETYTNCNFGTTTTNNNPAKPVVSPPASSSTPADPASSPPADPVSSPPPVNSPPPVVHFNAGSHNGTGTGTGNHRNRIGGGGGVHVVASSSTCTDSLPTATPPAGSGSTGSGSPGDHVSQEKIATGGSPTTGHMSLSCHKTGGNDDDFTLDCTMG